jgi:hypothetical protein
MRLDFPAAFLFCMETKYTSESEILNIIASFEDATIARGKWTHAEHLVVALYYLKDHDFEAACRKMKAGLMKLLIKGFKLDLTKEMPYHETLTMFWMRTVHRHMSDDDSGVSVLDQANALVAAYDKSYPLRFYSRERLFSDEARAAYIEPDLELSRLANS